jgi:hypothetical protein
MNNELPTPTPRELASRASHGLDVTLVWVQKGGEDKAVVCVCDRREGAYFEIPTEPHLALAVNYHPFAYRDYSTVDYEDPRLAASLLPLTVSRLVSFEGGVRVRASLEKTILAGGCFWGCRT